MGGHPYWYVVPYEDDINAALQKLRQREFAAGRYNPVVPFLEFPVGQNSPSPGPQHASIEEVLETTNEDGTRSILDIMRAAEAPFSGTDMPFMTVFPLPESELLDLFGDVRPTRQTVEKNHQFWDRIQRGSGIYVVLHFDGKPNELFFAGISFD